MSSWSGNNVGLLSFTCITIITSRSKQRSKTQGIIKGSFLFRIVLDSCLFLSIAIQPPVLSALEKISQSYRLYPISLLTPILHSYIPLLEVASTSKGFSHHILSLFPAHFPGGSQRQHLKAQLQAPPHWMTSGASQPHNPGTQALQLGSRLFRNSLPQHSWLSLQTLPSPWPSPGHALHRPCSGVCPEWMLSFLPCSFTDWIPKLPPWNNSSNASPGFSPVWFPPHPSRLHSMACPSPAELIIYRDSFSRRQWKASDLKHTECLLLMPPEKLAHRKHLTTLLKWNLSGNCDCKERAVLCKTGMEESEERR